ncbi:hypothetical protein POM88_005262 [Heracleum sosnowskyi]|uniref:Uncharacterized protein n=1 Tax=Heracleum sosnowskyi TaxID=360622 RepID=A0AAD8JND0_9APIA|nr:hypothetical protein POM88_005262 [Heracleum sosnowskyi]
MADDSSKIEVVAHFDMDNLSKPLYMHEMRSIRDVIQTDELCAGYRRTKLLSRDDAPTTKDVYDIKVKCEPPIRDSCFYFCYSSSQNQSSEKKQCVYVLVSKETVKPLALRVRDAFIVLVDKKAFVSYKNHLVDKEGTDGNKMFYYTVVPGFALV